MKRSRFLFTVEIGLIVAGVVLGLWCAAILLEAHRTSQAPIQQQPLRVTMALPGDEGRTAAASPTTRSLEPGTVIGRLESSALHLNAPVLEGSDDDTLNRGAGHIEDTAYPGSAGNVGIAGHRDTVFRPLEHAKTGDVLQLTTADRVYTYKITSTLIVDPDDVYVLDPSKEPTLTLVTCYPFRYIGHAPRRFVVQARLDER